MAFIVFANVQRMEWRERRAEWRLLAKACSFILAPTTSGQQLLKRSCYTAHTGGQNNSLAHVFWGLFLTVIYGLHVFQKMIYI